MSIHPTTTDEEVAFICAAIEELSANFEVWKEDYIYDSLTNEFIHNSKPQGEKELVKKWFQVTE